MKCPYAVDRRTVAQTSFEYNEDGVPTFQQTVENNTASFVECLREECFFLIDRYFKIKVMFEIPINA